MKIISSKGLLKPKFLRPKTGPTETGLNCFRCGAPTLATREGLCSSCYSWACYEISQGATPQQVFIHRQLSYLIDEVEDHLIDEEP